MKRLIVTADDFGLARAVNEAVEIAHATGILTHASLMVGAPAAADAVERARRLPGLAVGLHLVMSQGRPVLPAARLPAVTDRDGFLRSDLAGLGAAIVFRPDARAQIAAEIEAQFEAYAATGLVLDHVDAHQHFHLHPTLAALVMRIGARFGMRMARAPVEPTAVLRRIEPTGGSMTAAMTRPFTRRLQRKLRAGGFETPDQVFGLAWSGAMKPARVAGLLAHLPDGVTEIYMHPATSGGFERAARGYRYADELAALIAPEVVAAAQPFRNQT